MRRLPVRLVTAAVIALSLAACGSDGAGEVTAAADDQDATIEPVSEQPTATSPTAEPATAEPAPTLEPVQAAAAETGDGLFPTVVAAEARTSDDLSWRFDVTLLSEYDSPQRYADAWRVLDADDNELGIRVLGHDHAGEQPFTRSHSVDVPTDVTTVFIEGRDQVNGWSGERFELTLDR